MRKVASLIVVLLLAVALLAVTGTALAGTASEPMTSDVVMAVATPTPAQGQAWLGITLINLNEKLAERFNLSQTEGVAVASVVRNSPAEQSGVKRADIITAVNGQPVKTSQDVVDQVRKVKPGETVTLSILRKGESMTITVTAGTAPRPLQRLPRLLTPAPALPSLPPELQGLKDIPQDEVFNHVYGLSFTFTDKNNQVVVANVIPGKVTAISATSITIAPNNPQAKSGPFAIDGTTRIVIGGRAGGTDNIKVGDKVAIVVVGDSSHASMIFKGAEMPGVNDLLRALEREDFLSRLRERLPQLPKLDFRLPFRSPWPRVAPQQPLPPTVGSGA